MPSCLGEFFTCLDGKTFCTNFHSVNRKVSICGNYKGRRKFKCLYKGKFNWPKSLVLFKLEVTRKVRRSTDAVRTIPSPWRNQCKCFSSEYQRYVCFFFFFFPRNDSVCSSCLKNNGNMYYVDLKLSPTRTSLSASLSTWWSLGFRPLATIFFIFAAKNFFLPDKERLRSIL